MTGAGAELADDESDVVDGAPDVVAVVATDDDGVTVTGAGEPDSVCVQDVNRTAIDPVIAMVRRRARLQSMTTLPAFGLINSDAAGVKFG